MAWVCAMLAVCVYSRTRSKQSFDVGREGEGRVAFWLINVDNYYRSLVITYFVGKKSTTGSSRVEGLGFQTRRSLSVFVVVVDDLHNRFGKHLRRNACDSLAQSGSVLEVNMRSFCFVKRKEKKGQRKECMIIK
ncbi:uncharacterized protein [Physcomitrium patens]|uniref:uncharacterized protein n=1 Tax=Physcomitrium patens TaxID=3218 RepID=UPI003CCDF755